jgi:hypothetical protein
MPEMACFVNCEFAVRLSALLKDAAAWGGMAKTRAFFWKGVGGDGENWIENWVENEIENQTILRIVIVIFEDIWMVIETLRKRIATFYGVENKQKKQ